MVRNFAFITLWACLVESRATHYCMYRVPSGSTLIMTDSTGNSTTCQLDAIGGANALAVATIAGDGTLLLSSAHGELSLLE